MERLNKHFEDINANTSGKENKNESVSENLKKIDDFIGGLKN